MIEDIYKKKITSIHKLSQVLNLYPSLLGAGQTYSFGYRHGTVTGNRGCRV